MARVNVTQEVVLTAVVDRLVAQLAINANRCYVSTQPLSTIPPGGDYFVTVSLGDGQFDAEIQEQHAVQLQEQTEVIITVLTRMHLDRADRDIYLLTDDTRGLLTIKRLILKALVGHDLVEGAGDTFLRRLVAVKYAEKPQYDPEKMVGWLSIHFAVDFDWDLT